MKVFHHNDNDGRLAAWLVSHFNPDEEIAFKEINYDGPFPVESIDTGGKVAIVDFSVHPDDMQKILEKVSLENILWMDHHKTTIEKYDEEERFDYHDIPGIRDTGYSGCMLTWLYYHVDKEPRQIAHPMAKKAPYVVRLVDDWDCWKHEMEDGKAFNAGSKLYNCGPGANLWRDCIDSAGNAQIIVREGRTVLKYEQMRGAEYLKSFGYEVEIDGHLALVMNQGMVNSLWYGDAIDKYDLVASFAFNGEIFLASLYSTKIDVSLIAKARGGGGHKGAAGYPSKELPFSPK